MPIAIPKHNHFKKISSLISCTIREICLEFNQLTTVNLILERLNQKKFETSSI